MKQADGWRSGARYDAYMGRLSRLVAREFVTWIQAPSGGGWLDVGCGTGALSKAALEDAVPARAVCVDAARPFVIYALEQARDRRASFLVGNALALPFADETFETVVSGLALNFIPNPAGAAEEMARVATRGGVVGLYVWDYAEGMQPLQAFWAAAVEADPAAAAVDERHRFPLCRPGPLADLFDKAGLASVSVRAIDTAPNYQNFEDFWQPFLGGTGPAPSYLSGLSEEQRIEVRERVRSKLPVQADGGITVLARAWAVRGLK